MKITILTLFPDYFSSSLSQSMLGRAAQKGDVQFQVVDLREFSTDKHQTTDDRPFGGGAGMVMKVEPIDLALQQLVSTHEATLVVLLSAKGKQFKQKVAQSYSQLDHLILICGHYEGVDERVVEHLIDEELRIGDYVLTGGEPAALVVLDAVTRLIPGVLGNESSLEGESHGEEGVLAYPQYTRPEVYKGWKVPAELLSGDHAQIAKWREAHRAKDLKDLTEQKN